MLTMLYKILAACVVVAVIAATVLAFFIVEVDPAQKTIYDGLGRVLVPVPGWAGIVIREDHWAGLGWRLVDMVWFWGGLFIALVLFLLSGKGEARNQGAADAQSIFGRPDMTDMLTEVTDLMGSNEYLAMSDVERKNAVALVRRKHGFSDTF